MTTLIDQIPEQVWANWDASGEVAIVGKIAKPAHEHDCTQCTYLGTTGPTACSGPGINAVDHYIHVAANFRESSVIQRFGSNGPDYLSLSLGITLSLLPERYAETIELLRRRFPDLEDRL